MNDFILITIVAVVFGLWLWVKELERNDEDR